MEKEGTKQPPAPLLVLARNKSNFLSRTKSRLADVTEDQLRAPLAAVVRTHERLGNARLWKLGRGLLVGQKEK